MQDSSSQVLRNITLGLIGLVAIAAISMLLYRGWYANDLIVEANWPTRLDQTSEADMSISVYNVVGDPLSGANIELGHIGLKRSPGPAASRIVLPSPGRLAELMTDDATYETLATAETDENGRASLKVPPTSAFRLDSYVREMGARDGDRILVLRVTNLLSRHVAYVPLPSEEQARLTLATDRPLYQPGQRIRMRALTLDASSGRPVAEASGPAGAAVEFTVHGPRENLLWRERALVSPAGVASHAFDLAADGQQGTYKLTASYGDTSVSRQFDVRPYEKPRFEVELQTSRPRGDDETIRGSVQAAYFYGEPVADATVTVSARPAGPAAERAPVVATTDGSLDSKGRLDFELALDSNAQLSLTGELNVTATVTDSSGRMHDASMTLAEPMAEYDVEILPADAAKFRIGQTVPTVVIVRDRQGRPVEGATVEIDASLGALQMNLVSTSQESVTVTTDASGEATFAWTLPHFDSIRQRVDYRRDSDFDLSSTVSVALVGEDGAKSHYDVPVAVARPASVLLTPRVATPVAGEEVEFELQFPEGRHLNALDDAVTVTALHEEHPVASTHVAIGESSTATGSLVLGPEARGLTQLVVFNQRFEVVGGTPVWVRQRHGDEVSVRVTESTRRPGSPARIQMAFPVGEAQPTKDAPATSAPVTYGVWAVDEALYALKERVDLPLSLLARQRAETVTAVAGVLADLAGSPSAREYAAARLARDANVLQLPRTRHMRSLNRQVEPQLVRPWAIAWSVVLILLGLCVLLFESVRIWKLSDKRGMTWSLGAAIVSVPIAIVMGFVTLHHLPNTLKAPVAVFFVGAGLVLGVSGLFLVVYRERDLKFWQWPIALVVGLGLAGTAALLLSEHTTGDEAELLILVSALTISLLFIVQLLMWIPTLWARSQHYGTLALLVLFWSVPSVLVINIFGEKPKQKFARAEEAVDSHVRFGGEGNFGSGPEGSGGSSGLGFFELGGSQTEEEAAELQMAAEGAAPDGPARQTRTHTRIPLRVRDYFPDTMLWRPEVASGRDGRASVDLTLPDSITSWRVHAVAHTPDGRFGEGNTSVSVRQPFFIELDLPAQFTQGDAVSLPVTLVDARREPKGATRVELSAEAGGSLTASGADPSGELEPVELEAGGRKVVWVSVEATGLGPGSLTIRGRLEGSAGAAKDFDGDAVRRTTRVVANGRRLSEARSGIIGPGWTAQLDVPESAVSGSATARVDLLPGAVAIALEGLESMLRQPHGCFEQTTAIAYPNVLVLRALEETAPDEWPGGAEMHETARKEAIDLVLKGYQRILTFQGEDGGFALYPNREPTVILTAFGLLQLVEIQETLDIDATPAMRRAASWLEQQQTRGGSWNFDEDHRRVGHHVRAAHSTAFAVWALSRLPIAKEYAQTIARGADGLERHLDGERIGPYERALAANALLAADRVEEANRILDQLAAEASRRGQYQMWQTKHATWTGGRHGYADVATTALALRAMARAERHGALASEATNFLAGARRADGGWGTTEATLWALDAIASLRQGGTSDPVRLSPTLNGTPLPRQNPKNTVPKNTVPDTVRVIPERGVPHTLRAHLDAGSQHFEVTPSNKTNVLAQATVEYVVPWSAPQAEVSNEPFDLGLELASRTLAPRKRARIEVEVANNSGIDAAATIVKLPLPPGGWVDDAELRARIEAGDVDRVERTPTHLVVYLPKLDAGAKITLPYTVVPRLQGHYRLPPVIAYRYYNPTPASALPGGQIHVNP